MNLYSPNDGSKKKRRKDETMPKLDYRLSAEARQSNVRVKRSQPVNSNYREDRMSCQPSGF